MVCPQADGVAEELGNLVVGLAVNVEPAVQTLAAAVNGTNQRRELAKVKQERGLIVSRAGVELANEEATRPGVAQCVAACVAFLCHAFNGGHGRWNDELQLGRSEERRVGKEG